MSSVTTYDDVLYGTRPRMATHPDTAAVVAMMLGIAPVPVDRARVLEIGCGTGGNLTPMAALLPNSRFLGVDLSPVQIEEAKKTAAILGLANVEYRAESILDWDVSHGLFDYIICHGVYSWVPEVVSKKILAVCSRHLSPKGIAYVSYNTLPGWYLRSPVRDMLNYHVRNGPDAATRIRGARGLLQFLDFAVPESTKAYRTVVRDEVAVIADQPDYYLFHEHLESDNRPVYFHQFMAEAKSAGLQFVGEAGVVARLSGLPPAAREALEELCEDLLEVEQYLDFLHGRRFRRTLLCKSDLQFDRSVTPETLDRMYVSGICRPASAEPNLAQGAWEEFEAPEGNRPRSSSALLKTAIVELWRVFPGLLSVPELAAILAKVTGESAAALRGPLAQVLVECYLAGMLTLHSQPPAFVVTPSERPTGLPIARHFAAERATLPSARHQEVRLEPFDRFVLGLLDGTRDLEALTALADAALDAGTLPALDRPTPAAVEETLSRLGRAAVLVS